MRVQRYDFFCNLQKKKEFFYKKTQKKYEDGGYSLNLL